MKVPSNGDYRGTIFVDALLAQIGALLRAPDVSGGSNEFAQRRQGPSGFASQFRARRDAVFHYGSGQNKVVAH
jgi:hypothetical protein